MCSSACICPRNDIVAILKCQLNVRANNNHSVNNLIERDGAANDTQRILFLFEISIKFIDFQRRPPSVHLFPYFMNL